MEYLDREGNLVVKNDQQDNTLKKIYGSRLGRSLLQIATKPWISNQMGKILNSKCSRNLIQPFINANDIDMSLYKKETFLSYNDFFMREIKEEFRPIAMDQETLISPCDGKLSVYPITKHSIFQIKNSFYTVETLTHSKRISDYYEGGYALVFRLTVDDYHRYCYIDDGRKSKNYKIKGILHTVNPIANDYFHIYHENSREFSVLKSVNFGSVLMMEVGALMVGKIINDHEEAVVEKGQEKGHFEFGGSTVILLIKEDQVSIDLDILKNTKKGIETIVKMGEQIGVKKS